MPATGSPSCTSTSIGYEATTSSRISAYEIGSPRPTRWIAVEWPERAPQLAERCDLLLEFAIYGVRRTPRDMAARTDLGIRGVKVGSSGSV